ncbi:CoA-transferase family III domain-containing protein [Infundibulicybe gibba]|nr:CoA-transferase family III domain-containing protein [Infundibulicybe gibba]
MEQNYSVPIQAKDLLIHGIINNKLHSSAPPEIREAAELVEYVGNSRPVIPINWRFAESISAIKGFQSAMLNVLIARKYGVEYQKPVINTDHAQLFIMSVFLPVIDPHNSKVKPFDGGQFEKEPDKGRYEDYFPNCDKHGMTGPPLTNLCTNIYKTKDGRFFHLHGSMNARVSQEALGIPFQMQISSNPAASEVYQVQVAKLDSQEIDSLINERYRQAGTVCLSADEYKSSPHGRANAHVGLFEVHHIPNTKQAPYWWRPPARDSGPSRPLFGLKVLDLTRIIASPTITRELAEMGASVLRITSPNITDISRLNLDLGWGKWNAHLDLTRAEDRDVLRGLVAQADVVVDGYRPGVMEKWGFGRNDILAMFEGRDHGIVYVHENCYGWNGPWSHRSGWQQISDANCGVSLGFGQAMGLEEPVTPVFPNSDFCTGAAGATGILQALIERAEKGGSYIVDVALNYYSQWLVNSCSVYPKDVWEVLWSSYSRPVFRHTDNMGVLIPKFLEMLVKQTPELFNPEFFEERENKALGVSVHTVKPILSFPGGNVKLGYNVGTRGNGVDEPKWPEDLLTEVIR